MFCAAFIRGYSGFGFSAFSVSAAGLVSNPLLIAPVILLLEAMLFVLQWFSIRKDIAWRRVAALMAGALLGVPVGVIALTSIGIDAARATISIYVLAMCGLLISGWTIRSDAGDTAHVGTGVISGMANAAAIGGLPVAVFLAAQALPVATFRATLLAYFGFLDLWTVPVMAWRGFVTFDTLIVAVICLPIVQAGAWLGGKHFFRTDPQDFRRFAIIVLAVLAAIGLGKSVI